jgi:hypothetical protein
LLMCAKHGGRRWRYEIPVGPKDESLAAEDELIVYYVEHTQPGQPWKVMCSSSVGLPLSEVDIFFVVPRFGINSVSEIDIPTVSHTSTYTYMLRCTFTCLRSLMT